MCNMSRKSKSEYVAEKRRAYDNAGKAKRSRILDEACETLGHTRKYLIPQHLASELVSQCVHDITCRKRRKTAF
jgi:hypothetical protein